MSLEGKVAFITGVARGQGRSHAVRLAEEGVDIIGVDALTGYDTIAYPMGSREELDETVQLVEKQGRRMIATEADVRDLASLESAVAAGVEEFGRLDIVAANAGISPPGTPLWQLPPQEWQDVIDVNLTGVFNTLRASVPHMLEAGNGGSIVITSSGAGLKAVQNLADYNSSKFGVIGLGKTAANELAPYKIRVNMICPSTVATPMVLNDALYRLFRPDLENPTVDDAAEVFTQMNPLGEPWADPVDISNAVVWLCSEQARTVTGIVLPVDLGVSNKAL
jgi:(+)-trans-carveol dehydrogenase